MTNNKETVIILIPIDLFGWLFSGQRQSTGLEYCLLFISHGEIKGWQYSVEVQIILVENLLKGWEPLPIQREKQGKGLDRSHVHVLERLKVQSSRFYFVKKGSKVDFAGHNFHFSI